MDLEGCRLADFVLRRLELLAWRADLALLPTLEWRGCRTERERPRGIGGPRSSESSLSTSGRDWARLAFSCKVPENNNSDNDLHTYEKGLCVIHHFSSLV